MPISIESRLVNVGLIILLLIVASTCISTCFPLREIGMKEAKKIEYSSLIYRIEGPMTILLKGGPYFNNSKYLLYDGGDIIVDVIYCEENYCIVNMLLNMNSLSENEDLVFHRILKLFLSNYTVYTINGEFVGKWIYNVESLSLNIVDSKFKVI